MLLKGHCIWFADRRIRLSTFHTLRWKDSLISVEWTCQGPRQEKRVIHTCRVESHRSNKMIRIGSEKKKEGRKHTRRQKKACRFARTKKPELQQQRQQRNITLSVRFSNLFEKQNITFGESVDSSTCFQIFSKSFLLCFFFLRLWHCETQIRIYYLRR